MQAKLILPIAFPLPLTGEERAEPGEMGENFVHMSKAQAANKRLRWKMRPPNQMNRPVNRQITNPINITTTPSKYIAPAIWR